MILKSRISNNHQSTPPGRVAIVLATIFCVVMCPISIFSAIFSDVNTLPDSIPLTQAEAVAPGLEVVVDSISGSSDHGLTILPADSVEVVEHVFNPDPTRAVWLSALCPGLGQIYNRRYWKLPIVIGAFMGLGYGTSWNNGMLRDYTTAYNDLLDNDPTTKSYMDFFPSTTREEDLDKTWLTNTFKRRKDYFRRNRDLCIICMVGVYLVAMVDAYVDASLSHFDISPELSVDVAPALFQDGSATWPGVGLQWAFNF